MVMIEKYFGEYPKGFPAWISLGSKHERAGEDVLMDDVVYLVSQTMHIVKPKQGGDSFPIRYEHLLFDIAERAGVSIWGNVEGQRQGPWPKQKTSVKKKYGNRCACCGGRGFLHMHHTTYALSCFPVFEPDNVFLPVCEDCHFNRLHRPNGRYVGDPEQASAVSILSAGIGSEFRREDDEGINGAKRIQVPVGEEVRCGAVH